jgi:hypothetical protein
VDRAHTPEQFRNAEREQERLERLQMTSPTIRRQRVYERQQPPAQPIFTSVRPYVDWQQNLIQGFEERHAERVRHRHSRTGRHYHQPR